MTSKPLRDSIVVYHGQCADGFAAAFAAWLKLRDSADYLPYEYGMAPPDATNKAVYIVDFSFPRQEMDALNEKARRVVLLDHHQTAINKLSGYSCCDAMPKFRRLAVNAPLDPLTHHRFSGHTNLDTAKSGARLAWEYFHGQFEVPELIQFVEDRDLWRFRFGALTRHYLAKLDSIPVEFPAWNKVLQMQYGERHAFLAAGEAMTEKFDALVAELAVGAMPVKVWGHEALMVNTTREFASNVGELLAQKCGTFGVAWTLEKEGTLKVSLRSRPGVDVRVIAEAFGGGGHPNAAAFRLPANRFSDIARGVLEPAPT